MKKLYLNLLLCGLSLFPVLLWGAGKDSIQVLSRPEQYLYAPEKFFTAVYNNPATHFFAHESSLTRLSIYSTYNKKTEPTCCRKETEVNYSERAYLHGSIYREKPKYGEMQII